MDGLHVLEPPGKLSFSSKTNFYTYTHAYSFMPLVSFRLCVRDKLQPDYIVIVIHASS